MKFSLAVFIASAASSVYVNAFAPSASGRFSPVTMKGGMSDDVGIPCEGECALESFPNLPESVHPGVLSGQAMMDLLQHAKDNGKDSGSARGSDRDRVYQLFRHAFISLSLVLTFFCYVSIQDTQFLR